jgi:hypothetical protein
MGGAWGRNWESALPLSHTPSPGMALTIIELFYILLAHEVFKNLCGLYIHSISQSRLTTFLVLDSYKGLVTTALDNMA